MPEIPPWAGSSMTCPRVTPNMETHDFQTWRKDVSVICGESGCSNSVRSRGVCVLHYWGSLSEGEQMAASARAESRFWSKVDKSGECWEWTASKYGNGYGAFRGADSRVNVAHRYALTLSGVEFPEDAEVDHLCFNRGCVNPGHLRITTAKQNMENRSGSNSNCKSGYRGVYYASGAWRVKVRHNRKAYYAGGFSTAEEANTAAINLRNELFTHNSVDRAGV